MKIKRLQEGDVILPKVLPEVKASAENPNKFVSQDYMNKRYSNIMKQIPGFKTNLWGYTKRDSIHMTPLLDKVESYAAKNAIPKESKDIIELATWPINASYAERNSMPFNKNESEKNFHSMINKLSDKDITKLISIDPKEFKDMNFVEAVFKGLKYKPKELTIGEFKGLIDYFNTEDFYKRYPYVVNTADDIASKMQKGGTIDKLRNATHTTDDMLSEAKRYKSSTGKEVRMDDEEDRGKLAAWLETPNRMIGMPTDSILYRQAFKESSFNPKAKSKAGAKGLTQIMPSVKADYDSAHGTDVDLFDPEDAVGVQKWYWDDLYNASFINKPGQDEIVRKAKTLAAYNWGRTNLRTHLNLLKVKGVDIYKSLDWVETLPLETKDYINKILLRKSKDFEEDFNKADSTYSDFYFKDVQDYL